MHAWTCAVVTVTLSALTLSACSLGEEISAEKLETQLRKTLEDKKVVVESVKCPKGRKVKEGDKFDCKAKTAGGQDVVIHCRQADGAGNVKAEIDGRAMDQTKLGLLVEFDLAKRYDQGKTKVRVGKLTMSCPDKVLFVPSEGEAICEAKLVVNRLGGRSLKVAFRTGDGDSVTWKPTDDKALEDIEGEVEAKLKKDQTSD